MLICYHLLTSIRSSKSAHSLSHEGLWIEAKQTSSKLKISISLNEAVSLSRCSRQASVSQKASFENYRSMLVTACKILAALLENSACFESKQQCLDLDGSMWCLIYLEKESPTALVGLLKEKSFDVHIAADVDDLLDALWYHGSAVGCIVIETSDGRGLDEMMHALEDWPDLEVLIAGPTERSARRATQHRFEQDYSLQNVSHWLNGSLRGSSDGGTPPR